MKTPMRLAIAGCAAALLTISSIAYGQDRVTFGDVNSYFNSVGPALTFVEGTNPDTPAKIVAAPVDGLTRGRIIPLVQDEDPRHCANDWILVSFAMAAPADFFTRSDAIDVFAGREHDYLLNGAPVETLRTPLQRTFREESDGTKLDLWFINTGFFIEPGSLSTGFHTTDVLIIFDDVVAFQSSVYFEIVDASDPYCTG